MSLHAPFLFHNVTVFANNFFEYVLSEFFIFLAGGTSNIIFQYNYDMKAHYTQLIWSWHLCAVVESSSCVSSSGAPTTTTTNSTSNNNTSNSTSGGSAGKNNSTSEAHIPPLLGVAPLGPAQLTVEHELQFKMLQAAFFHMPHPSDSERLRLHLPRQPCQTPLYYPQVWDPSSSSNPSVISFF